MDLIKNKLTEIIRLAQDIKAGFDAAAADSPRGILTYQKSGDRTQLIHMYREDGRRIRHGINRDTDLQKALAQKEFAQLAGQTLSEILNVLENAARQLPPFDPDELLADMPPAYARLPDSYFFDRESLTTYLHLPGEDRIRIQRHREWGRQPYKVGTYRPEHRKHRTSRGLKMRSKSEVLIMERLYCYGIDVRYEQEWTFGNDMIVPDFTFEGEDGKLFCWEHLGMMDDPRYAAKNYEKLMKYFRHGLVLGKNLLVSFDRYGTIDMKLIDFIIRNDVIPRL